MDQEVRDNVQLCIERISAELKIVKVASRNKPRGLSFKNVCVLEGLLVTVAQVGFICSEGVIWWEN